MGLCHDSRDFCKTLLTFPKPLVAAVNGAAVGLGVTFLPYFDLVYASDKATFYTPYGKLGQIPEGGATFTLPSILGYARVSPLKALKHFHFFVLCSPIRNRNYLSVGFVFVQTCSALQANGLLLEGRRLTATEAHEFGLVTQVLWPSLFMEEVIPRVRSMASRPLQVSLSPIKRPLTDFFSSQKK